jgi:hypothetical protein
MRISRPSIHFALILLLLGASAAVWAQAAKTGKKNTVPPPKWDPREVDKVFFKDVASRVGPGQPGGARPAVGSVAPPTPGATSTGGTATPAAAGGFSWSKLADAETLETEIKKSINALGPTVDNPGQFKNQHFRQARRQYSSLAVWFGVLAGYDGSAKWKDKAAGLRDSMAKAGFNCKVGSDQSFLEAKGRYEDLRTLLEGGSPKLPQAEAAAEWKSVADLTELMKRMEEAGQNQLTPWTASANEFKANKDKILHEAQLLAVLAQVIKHPSYEYGQDANFVKYADDLQNACLGIVEGAKTDNYDKARASAGAMSKACNACHGDFR